jgi:dihydroorotase
MTIGGEGGVLHELTRSAGRVLIRGGRVLDPVQGRDGPADVLLEDGVVVAVEAALEAPDAEVLDVSGCWVAPGFVDLHTHLREPGQEYKEDIASGGRAAVSGGFTAVVCMANTQPVNDDPSVTEYILERARRDSPARVYPIAAATRGLEGVVMTEFDALVRSGAVAFSDDGHTIMDGGVMRRVLEYSRLVSRPVFVTRGQSPPVWACRAIRPWRNPCMWRETFSSRSLRAPTCTSLTSPRLLRWI